MNQRAIPSPSAARLAALIIAALLIALPALAAAQVATPTAGGAWVGQEPDLAAMPLRPSDMEALGFPGYGRFFNGFYNSLEMFSESEGGFLGQPVAEARAFYESIGWSRMYGTFMGLPSVPGEESPPVRGVFSNILEVADAAGADAFLTYNLTPGPETEFTIDVREAPFALGDRAIVFANSIYNPDAGETFTEAYTVFHTGNLIGISGFTRVIPDDTGTPEASPAAATAAPIPPAATLAELELIGGRHLARIEAVRTAGGPNLASLLLRLGADPLDATADYTEGYRLINGEIPPYYDFADDILADPAAVTGADAVYELEERFQPGQKEAPTDHYFLNRLYRFPDEPTASAFIASRPAALATGGFNLATGATEESRTDPLPGEATGIGDESLAFAFVRAFDDGGRYEGYEVFVRVGAMVAAVSLEGPPGMPLETVTEIATAQAACLDAGACPEALPVPESFHTIPVPTPEARPLATVSRV